MHGGFGWQSRFEYDSIRLGMLMLNDFPSIRGFANHKDCPETSTGHASWAS
jgi:hypothetical protein